jgi:uncharacterized protein
MWGPRAAAALLLAAALAAAGVLLATLVGDLAGTSAVNLPVVLTPITSGLLLLVTGLGAVIGVYAARNLAGQHRLVRFAGLELLVVAGLALAVTAATLPVLALGWTLAGLAVAGLVGHAGTPEARAAQRLVRGRLLVGDALLWAAVVAAAALLGTTSVAGLADAAAAAGAPAVGVVAVLVVLAGVVRSALVPAHRWLPETTAAPSPVSALLHAGVVNGIGVLALLLWPLVMASGAARGVALVLGAATAVLATAQQRVRPDVKGRLVSSTSAQMGYLAICVGLGLPAAVLVHLVGHGLWKASLFLGAGGAVTRARAAHAASPGRGALAPALAAAGGGSAALLAATVPGPWGPSLLTGPAVLLPVTVAAVAAATAAGAAARLARGPRAAASAMVLAAVAAYVLAVRAVDHALEGVLGRSTPAWGEPGAAAVAAVVVALLAVGAVGWRLDRVLAAGGLPRLAAAVARTTAAPVPLGPGTRPTVPAPLAHDTRGLAGQAALAAAAARIASDAVAPLWPLHAFVASNPLAGLEQLPFRDAVRAGSAAWGARSGVDAALLRRALAAGSADADAVDRVCASVAPGPDLPVPGPVRTRSELVRALLLDDPAPAADVARVRAALGAASPRRPRPATLRSPAESAVAARPALAAADCRARDLVSLHAARVHGGPAWPVAVDGVWASLHADAASLDRLLGLPGAGAWVGSLPQDAEAALATVVQRLGLAGSELVPAFTRVLARDPGWVAHLAWRARVGIDGESDELLDLLVARLALEGAVAAARGPVDTLVAHEAVDVAPAVATMLRAAGFGPRAVGPAVLAGLVEIADAAEAEGVELLRLRAWEESYRVPLLAEVAERARLLARGGAALAHPGAEGSGPEAQVVTCIDVRSERLRRHLEEVGPWETFGAAGFFGLPFAHVGPDGAPSERLPALLRPRHVVVEQAGHGSVWLSADAAEGVHAVEARAAAPFALAEAAGWVTGPDAMLHTLAPRTWNRLRHGVAGRLGRVRRGPIVVGRCDLAPSGFALEEQVDAAEAFLRTIGLREPAPLVLLVGHGAAVANNPHVAAYDCGACGGQPGDVSARAMAQVLNDADVRTGLAARGIEVPAGTWFGAALHNTTVDAVELLDDVPGHLRPAADGLMGDLAAAGAAVSAERSAHLPGRTPSGGRRLRHELDRRSVDWAQVRPEWSLARNAAIVIGPRSLTSGLDLDGRVFLHSYRPDLDADGSALEFLLTAPLVVAQWISAQYWCSTVDPECFGAGDKTTHNVVAAHDGGPATLTGVLTGARGDLRVGLPWQAVSAEAPVDGGWRSLPFHEPLRLLAVVCAAPDAVDRVLERHPEVARLVAGEWISLVVVEPESGVLLRSDGAAAWAPVEPAPVEPEPVEPEPVEPEPGRARRASGRRRGPGRCGGRDGRRGRRLRWRTPARRVAPTEASDS